MSAKEAFKAYIRAYASHHIKDIFNIHELNLTQAALSFGFTVPPHVDIDVNSGRSSRPRRKKGGGGYGVYNKMNQKRDVIKARVFQPNNSDKRQWSR